MRAEVVAMDAAHLNMEAIRKAGEILKKGGLVAFPTETVYGLVTTTAIFLKNLDQIRVRSCFYSKKFFESLVPCKSLF